MSTTRWILALAILVLLTACGGSQQQPATASAAYPEGSIKKGDKALCVVCVSKGEPAEEETAAEILDYQGNTYAFCSESEKAEFISNPSKYAAPAQSEP